MTDLKRDLGWLNAGGETTRIICDVLHACKDQKHTRIETNDGMSGTVHSVSCYDCGYVYRYDSGD